MQKRGKTALTLVGFAVMLAALLALMVSIGACGPRIGRKQVLILPAGIYHRRVLYLWVGELVSAALFEHPNRVVDQRQGVFGLSHGERPCARISERL